MPFIAKLPRLFAMAPAWLAQAACAHEGHGLPGAHWHATDVLGFIALAAAIGALIWFTRK